ncbi:MAG: hypothetical protein J0L78_11385 [Planctomycetes bacterium]|nr:hypothetical protein [Planctomycetota bacterium]
MSTEFESLVSFADWSNKLDELLRGARAALEADDESRLAVAQRLTAFVSHSFPASPEIRKLDDLARDAARALAEDVASDAVERLSGRAALLEILAGELAAVRSRASSIAPAEEIASVARRLAGIAEDAKALARFRAANPLDPLGVRTRIERISRSLKDLHASWKRFDPSGLEPVTDSPGTVHPEEARDQP